MAGNDRYLISVAKSEYRDGYNEGDPGKVLNVFAGAFIDMSEGQPSFFGGDARLALEKRLTDLFAEYKVELAPSIIDIAVQGDSALDFGWHQVTLTPKSSGATLAYKARYFERWSKQHDGQWKIVFLMTNREEPPRMEPLSECAVWRSLSAGAAS